MSVRPWLKALKEHSIRRGQEQEKTRETIFADAPGDELTKPTKALAPLVDINAARVPLDKDERRLLAAGWTPKERCGPLKLTIWANPETGFYCSQEVALHRIGQQRGDVT